MYQPLANPVEPACAIVAAAPDAVNSVVTPQEAVRIAGVAFELTRGVTLRLMVPVVVTGPPVSPQAVAKEATPRLSCPQRLPNVGCCTDSIRLATGHGARIEEDFAGAARRRQCGASTLAGFARAALEKSTSFDCVRKFTKVVSRESGGHRLLPTVMLTIS